MFNATGSARKCTRGRPASLGEGRRHGATLLTLWRTSHDQCDAKFSARISLPLPPSTAVRTDHVPPWPAIVIVRVNLVWISCKKSHVRGRYPALDYAIVSSSQCMTCYVLLLLFIAVSSRQHEIDLRFRDAGFYTHLYFSISDETYLG